MLLLVTNYITQFRLRYSDLVPEPGLDARKDASCEISLDSGRYRDRFADGASRLRNPETARSPPAERRRFSIPDAELGRINADRSGVSSVTICSLSRGVAVPRAKTSQKTTVFNDS
ncbi:hypothetical protein EVAR_25366_1 [Eumeta japonica]|uniref:Uncharacterized protein n=1 Tax=Eumeta variegata TaxID=151549 RepID=A0A4C1XXR0_EUMVA|nr:hypothetical protein EVAR_25366_1 [Eumeta japonica]